MKSIGITLGDPAGVGPEILVKSLSFLAKQKCFFLLFGDENLLKREAKHYNVSLPSNLKIINLSELKVQPGKPTPESQLATLRYLEEAIRYALSGELKALVTLPINKEVFKLAGLPFRGHTEYLAHTLGAKAPAMSFYGRRLRVTLITTHLPLRDVFSKLEVSKIVEIARLAYDFTKRLNPRKRELKIALSALNPHAGEGGLLGDEEERLLKPAIKLAQDQGIPLYGPYPADSLFYFASQGYFDHVLSLYHDQGLIPFKLFHFRDGVNVTLGLPIVRTSPVHGTAYDIAGQGKAFPDSFISAVKLALRLSK